MTTAKLIYFKLINNEYRCELKNNIDLKKKLIIHNINKCFGTIAKFNIIFIIFSGKNKNKMLFNLTNKK